MNEFLQQFLVEARELVEQATSDLLTLERSPTSGETLDSAFRAFHTLKGGSGIVDFAAMGRAVHAVEEVLSTVRSGERPVTSVLIGDCLSCLDRVVLWLDIIQDSGELPTNADADADRVIARFSTEHRPAADTRVAPADEEGASLSVLAAPVVVLRNQLLLLTDDGPAVEGRIASAGRLAANVLRHLGRFAEAEEIARSLSESLARLDATPLARAISRAAERGAETPPTEAGVAASSRRDPLSRTLRIDAGRVNALVSLAGELTISKNAVGHIAKLAHERQNPLATQIKEEHERLDRLIGAFQLAVLELRVMPLRNVFQRFSRLVREMSTLLGKPARLVIEGEDTEADKAIVEMLFEPLLHVVRNAIDHGVEPGPERASRGKPAIASVYLRARREGDRVLVEVEDDGRGIDAARIRKAAVERGIGSLEDVSAMNDEEAVDLIFVSGISTAASVSSLSGRGVGMDAVRTSVERLGGRVDVKTRPGAGSTVRFVLPFSVMMTRVMTVEAGGQLFGVPIDAVVETVRVEREQIQPIGLARAFVLRNRTVPLIELWQTLGLSPSPAARAATVVVVGLSGGQLGGLEVDRLGEPISVMLQAPEGLLAGIPEIAGTTLLGDGSVLLVLDVRELLR